MVGVIGVDQAPPCLHWHPESRLFTPWDGRDLRRARARIVKDRAAEEEAQWNLTAFQPVEVLGGSHIEVEGTGHLRLHGSLADEGRRGGGDVGPQHVAERLAPSLGLAEQVEQMLLILRRVAAARDFDLNLATQ